MSNVERDASALGSRSHVLAGERLQLLLSVWCSEENFQAGAAGETAEELLKSSLLHIDISRARARQQSITSPPPPTSDRSSVLYHKAGEVIGADPIEEHIASEETDTFKRILGNARLVHEWSVADKCTEVDSRAANGIVLWCMVESIAPTIKCPSSQAECTEGREHEMVHSTADLEPLVIRVSQLAPRSAHGVQPLLSESFSNSKLTAKLTIALFR